MGRSQVGAVVVGAIALTAVAALVVGGPARPVAGVAQGDVEATATREAEVAEVDGLRTQVAALSTEVAGLRALDDPLAARLGGTRASFVAWYGAPVASEGPDVAEFAGPAGGRLTATFAGERARELVLVPARASERLDEPDPADWTLDEARDIARRFAPSDATLADEAVPSDGTASLAGESETLAATLPAPVSACGPGEAAGFEVRLTMPTAETVSSVTLVAGADGAGGVVSSRATTAITGGGAVATVSLGGSTTVNGIGVQAFQAVEDARGALPAAPGERLVAVEVEIRNGTGGELPYEPSHFRLTDAAGRDVEAACGGAEPAVTSGVVAPGGSVRGWVTFAIPEAAQPTRFTYLVGGSDRVRASFILG